MMEAPPPPPLGVATAAVPSMPSVEASSTPVSPRSVSGASHVTGDRPASVVRHVSVPCDSSSLSVDVLSSHSLPRPALKSRLSSGNKVSVLS